MKIFDLQVSNSARRHVNSHPPDGADLCQLPYIKLDHWFCSHFQLETPLNFHMPINVKSIQCS